MTTYLKVLGPENRACHGGAFDYADYLPQGDEPGPWLPAREPKLCWSGWHWCTPESLMRHWAVANMRVYVAEPSADVTGLTDDGKCVSSSGRLLREYPLPEWWTEAMRFVNEELPNVPWMQRVGPVEPTWRVFPTLDAAWYAAGVAARAAARAAAGYATRDAARDAALFALTHYVCADLPLAQEHRDHAAARWEVWKRGYGLLGDVEGVLYVYEAVR